MEVRLARQAASANTSNLVDIERTSMERCSAHAQETILQAGGYSIDRIFQHCEWEFIFLLRRRVESLIVRLPGKD